MRGRAVGMSCLGLVQQNRRNPGGKICNLDTMMQTADFMEMLNEVLRLTHDGQEGLAERGIHLLEPGAARAFAMKAYFGDTHALEALKARKCKLAPKTCAHSRQKIPPWAAPTPPPPFLASHPLLW